MLSFAAITPHPPIIIPGVGQEKDLKMVKETVVAMEKLGKDLEKINPDVVIIISPHAPLEPYSFMINSEHYLQGSFSDFGLNKKFRLENDTGIVEKIIRCCYVNGEMPSQTHKSKLDHGAMVPLYYLLKNIKPCLVHLSFSFLGFSMHYDYGEIIGKICDNESKRIAVIASGDLSHRLIPQAPAGYSPKGKEFDKMIIKLLEKNDLKNILELDHDFVEEAGECGLRSIIILLGALKGREYKFDLLSYEDPFGVGYLTARLF